MKNKTDAGADNKTPSIPQYFSWINSTNEGSTEEQTLINLDFFRYLKEKYGMQIKIYAWDAGNFDGASEGYGNLNGEKFKSQYPQGYKNVVAAADKLGIKMGLWGSPDGYGDDENTEKERFDFFVHLCRDYGFSLFKLDGVCGQLRPEKAPLFAQMLRECRKYSPNLVVLNHRLNLYEAEKHVTTYLWNGEETYVDVFEHNKITAMHNRAHIFSRGNVDNLDRLAEDHGVCISSSIDYFEDDLIYQAFGRCLILAPEMYGNPWLMRDDELPKLARVYNLHRRNAAILVDGMVLPEKYGPCAVARGSSDKRFICTGNDTWEKKTLTLSLNEEIGLSCRGKVVVNIHHPYEKHIGEFSVGDTVTVELMPFRAALIEVSVPGKAEIMKDGEYEIIREDENGNPVEIKLLDENSKERAPLKIGKLDKVLISPANGEQLYEAAVFGANNDSLEYRSLLRSGETEIPQVKAARDAFFNQKTYKLRGCESRALFDGNPDTFFDGQSKAYQGRGVRIGEGCLRVDFGDVYNADYAELICFAVDEFCKDIRPQSITPFAEGSTDFSDWEKSGAAQTEVYKDNYIQEYVVGGLHITDKAKGKLLRIVYPLNGALRYLRIPAPCDRIFSVKLYKDGKEIPVLQGKANNLQKPYQIEYAPFVKYSEISLPKSDRKQRIAVAINGKHGDEGVYCCAEIDGKLVGFPARAPEFKANIWEHRVCEQDKNYTYFMPVSDDMKGKTVKIYAVFKDGKPEYTDIDVYICDIH